jgi:hypothetical protein
MAFRAWNRGLAATSTTPAGGTNPFGVWIFNGTRWFPDPTFPGGGVCKGTRILWAGKLDYWLVGGPPNWPSLCRFDGVNFLWEPLPVPAATLARITPAAPVNPAPGTPKPLPNPGNISSGACYSYDDCWFFGSYGSIVHWNGTTLADASPDPSAGWLATAFGGAIARVDLSGNPFGAAVGATSVGPVGGGPIAAVPLPAQPDGTPPPQLYGSTGGAFGPLPFAPTTAAVPSDPYRTDLVAVDFGPDRQGWVAGNPAGLAATAQSPLGAIIRPLPRPGPRAASAAPAPLLTTTAAGANSTCTAPPADRFTYSAADAGTDSTDAFLWSSISVIPGSDDALAGGLMWPAESGPGPDEDGAAEPVIVDARCDGTTTTTNFRVPDPSPRTPAGALTPSLAPADRGGTITAVAANAVNDAWAATSAGGLDEHDANNDVYNQAPHLYRLTDGQPPDAALGDDYEPRPLTLLFDPPAIPEPPPPAPPAPPPAPVVKQTPTRDPPASVYHVESKLHGKKKLELYLTFDLRRPVTLGAQALLHGRVISSAPLHHFTGRSGRLVLPIDPKRYPTKVVFTSDAPRVRLDDPGSKLTGTVELRASATPYRRRHVASVSFEYSPAGQGTWTTIATSTAPPWTASFATAGLAPGRYDLRAVATDSAKVTALSTVLANRTVTKSGSS